MTSDSRIGLMAQLEEARKEIEYYRRLAREAGNIRLRETEELSNVIGDLRRTKQVLEQEKLRFLSLAEQAPYAMAMISPAGHFLYVNPKFEEMFGYDLSEIPMGRDWFRKAYPNEEYRHQVIAAWLEDHARSGSGEQRHRIFAVTCKDGREKIIHFRPVQFQTGEHLMTCEDITERTRAREALERSEANYRAVLDSMNDAVFVHDAETGAILDVNNKMSEMYGYTRREATCLTVEELSLGKPPYTQEETAQWITRAVEQGPQLFAWLARDKTGRLFWVEVNLKVAVIGGERRILAVVRDITDRKKAEEALRQSELRYRTLVEESFDGIFVQEGSRIVFANSKLCRMLGYEEGELEGKEHWEVYGPAYHDLTRERAQARMRGEQVPSRYEVKLQRKDGASFDGEISAKAVKLGEERGIQVWVRDISQRKRVEEALRESEERLRLAWDTSPEAFSISRLNDGVYVDVNRGYLDLTGYSREEVIGKSALDLPFWQNPADRQPLVSGLTQDGYVRDLETRIYRKDGELRTVLISGGLMMLHGEPHLLAIT
ncbi:MAG: PAS domain S-box protein, partial [Deltaproteobacteria bacterium]|nr:PAS domain S-box protein [Deltaproteobacteria bacterium]